MSKYLENLVFRLSSRGCEEDSDILKIYTVSAVAISEINFVLDNCEKPVKPATYYLRQESIFVSLWHGIRNRSADLI